MGQKQLHIFGVDLGQVCLQTDLIIQNQICNSTVNYYMQAVLLHTVHTAQLTDPCPLMLRERLGA